MVAHDVVTPRRHYVDDATVVTDLAGSGTLTPEEHFEYTCRHGNPEAKVVFASTRQIYGRPEYLPVDERHPLQPADVNGINKLAGEWYHIVYHNVYGLRTVSLRLTNTYGPRMRIRDARQTFIGWWFRQLLEGQTLHIFGDEQEQCFYWVYYWLGCFRTPKLFMLM